jgi:YggT family protein
MVVDIAKLLVTTVVDIYTLIVVLRFLLQLVRADFYNPISQLVVKATDPLLKPLRRVVPGFWGLDIPSLLLALLVQITGVLLLAAISNLWGLNPLVYLLAAVFGLLEVTLNFYFFAIIIVIVISWVAAGSYNPAAALLSQVTEPVMAPFRRILPAMGGLDFSPMVVLFIIHVLRTIILPSMLASLGG